MTRGDLVRDVVTTVGVTDREAKEVIEIIFNSIARALGRNERIELRGFGSFYRRQRRGRVGRNPKTGAQVIVPAKNISRFKASKELLAGIERAAMPPPGL